METITLEINKRTKAGKAFLEMMEVFLKDKKGIKIVRSKTDMDKDEDAPLSKNIPNEETLHSMAKTKKRIGLTHCKNAEDMYEKLGI